MLNTITIFLMHMAALLGFSAYPLDIHNDMEGMLKLANYATWNDNADEIRIVMASRSDESFHEASQYLKNRNLNDRKISLTRYTTNMDLCGTMILYIEDGADINVEQVTEANSQKQMLTISNSYDNLDRGCMFYIKSTDGSIDYKYNKQAVIESGLVIKSSALSPTHCYNPQ